MATSESRSLEADSEARRLRGRGWSLDLDLLRRRWAGGVGDGTDGDESEEVTMERLRERTSAADEKSAANETPVTLLGRVSAAWAAASSMPQFDFAKNATVFGAGVIAMHFFGHNMEV